MSLVALVRSQERPGVERQLDALVDHPDVHGALVLVPADEDGPATARRVRDRYGGRGVRVHTVDPWGWSKALNAGFREIDATWGREAVVWCLSVDVRWDATVPAALEQAARRQGCGFGFFEGRTELPYLVPRNTCAAWTHDAWVRFGGFDEALDEGQGMEDYDAVLRLARDEGRLPEALKCFVRAPGRGGPAFERTVQRETARVLALEDRYPSPVVDRVTAHLRDHLALLHPEADESPLKAVATAGTR
ncbi:MAG: hypothetical protein H6732_06485 [Alphaproteobacteria bacterium]|nr:hypothetical protein [Alphaproteobacteria bacterium]